jgi:hypothetical protein
MMSAPIDKIPVEPSRRQRATRLVVATILVMPATVFLAMHVLQYGIGIDRAADWIDALFDGRWLGWVATGVVLGGSLIALVLAVAWFLQIRVMRDGEAWELRIRVRFDRWALAVATVSAGVGGFLVAHIAFENLACALGFSSVC